MADTATSEELSQLARSYKIMENDRQKYSEEAQSILRRLRKGIEKMKKENDQLKELIAMEDRTAMRPNDAAVASHVARLQDQVDLYNRKIDLEKRRAEEVSLNPSKLTQQLDKQTKILNIRVLEYQQQRGGVNAARQSEQQIQRQIKVLENRLDKALVKFNEALSYNKSLREQIDNLRRERVVFDQINAKLAKELHEKKKEMAQIIEISNIAYEARWGVEGGGGI
jgi:coiled-coil domain-containing protein 63/114